MTFFVLDANPVKSANRLCWLDCESAAYDGARILVSAFQHEGADVSDMETEPMDHPLVRWAVVSSENARWLYRYTRAATIKWGRPDLRDPNTIAGYGKMMKRLNEVAGMIDKTMTHGQRTLFGNFYIDGEIDIVFKQETLDSNNAYYEKTREHLRWADHAPSNYGRGEEE